MEKSEQWLSDGKCNICRREKYCNKPCKACNNRKDNIVRGAVIQAFVHKLRFNERRCEMICEECKSCWNYMICENGCYGSDKLCEYFVSDTDN